VRGDVKIWKEKSAKRKEVRQKRKDVVILQGHTFPSSKALETLWSFCVICKVACVMASRARALESGFGAFLYPCCGQMRKKEKIGKESGMK